MDVFTRTDRRRAYSILEVCLEGSKPSAGEVSLCVKRVVELDGKFSNRAKGEDKADKAGTAYPENEVYRGVPRNECRFEVFEVFLGSFQRSFDAVVSLLSDCEL